jgi:potassium efflux system protein
VHERYPPGGAIRSPDRAITPGKIVIALSVFIVGYIFARFMMPIFARRFFPRLGFDAGASNAFASLMFYALIGVAFLFALRAVNIPLTAFAVVGGALALGIGFGSQAVVSNFISGLLLLAERPIRIGDLVEIGGVIGTVEAIGLRSTRIRTADNFHIIVPNASFLETNVINWTHQDPRMRLRVSVGVAYGSPVREVERLLIEAATAHPRSLDHPAPATYFQDFGDSALLFEIRFWIRYDERTDRPAILSDLRYQIDALFAENGIVIAYPQIDVHFDDPGKSP